MDGPAFDVTELPPKRGAPPKFRRNRVATIATLCVLGFAAGMGVQWGMLRRGPPSAPPANSEPKRAPVSTAPRKHAAITVGSDAPSQTVPAEPSAAAAPPQAPTTPAAGTGPAPVPLAPSVGLSRDALYYGRGAAAQAPASAEPQPAAEPVQVATVETPPSPPPTAETRPVPAARAKTGTSKAVVAEPAPKTVRVSAEPPATRPLADPTPAQPSFDCSRATSPGERQVCRNPRLAELDARMDAIYRRALSAARDPRALKADQDRWMAVREGAALRDPSMVGPAYERRIAELSRRDW